VQSGGNEHAANYNSNGSYDVGLWQINDGSLARGGVTIMLLSGGADAKPCAQGTSEAQWFAPYAFS
jgi:hypothetical protein